MPSPFLQLPGSVGARDELQQMIAEKMQRDAIARQVQQQQFDQQMQTRSMGLQEQNANSMEMARTAQAERDIAMANKPDATADPLVEVDEDGQSVYKPRSQAAGLRAYHPKTTPASEPMETVDEGGQPILRPRSQVAGLRAYQAPKAAPQERAPHRVVQQGIGPDGTPTMMSVDLDTGEATPVKMPDGYQPNRPAKPVTPAERQTLSFYNRMKDAVGTLETAGDGGKSLEDQVSAQNLLGQAQGQYMPNIGQSGLQQKYRQLQRAYTEARLRKESGAAIPESEFQNDAKTYFFQPGDKPETIKQKREKRQTVLNGLKFAAGRAFDEFYGDKTNAGKSTADPMGIR